MMSRNSPDKRLSVAKTYKLYIGGKFPRTESGRTFEARSHSGDLLANLCQASRKDLREAVVVARKAFPGWAKRSGYNRGQILYRIAEMMEGRIDQLANEISSQGVPPKKALKEVETSIERFVHYAGWADKYAQIHSSVNPVSTAHLNFSVPDPMGIVGIIPPNEPSLLGLATLLAPALAGGNVAISLVSETRPLAPATFAEILHSSDVPEGVVNILTGFRKELLPDLSTHMDVNAILAADLSPKERKLTEENSALNLKRVIHLPLKAISATDNPGISPILSLQETKTTWHPIGT
jgi:acyl-CoA reductase-like NAD-dependent aldehyde dehydrogenase